MQRMAWLKRTASRTAETSDAVEFARLLRDHVPAFYRAAYRWTGAVDRAEDLVQQLLLRLYPRLAELRELDQIRPWALRVMYRIFIDQLRRERSSPVQFGADPVVDDDVAAGEDEAWLDPGPGPQELSERELTQERVLRAWEQLGRSTAWCWRCTTSRTTPFRSSRRLWKFPSAP
jgi:RNA polymerase sigma-70 factor (ECF subfamily)